MHTSSRSLPAELDKKLKHQLFTLLADLKHPKEVATVMNSLLGEVEMSVITKRLGIVTLLNQNKSYSEIKKTLNVSSATISSLAENLKEAGWQTALKKIAINEWAEKILSMFDTVLYGQRKRP